MCFAPQRRALFRHLNFQNCSEPLSFSHILLPNLLRATTPCTFSTSQLPKVVRSWGVLYLFTSKSASRHNGVQLFISHLPRCLRTRRFSEPTFQPSGATKPCFATFLPFRAPASSFFWSFLFWLFSLLTAFSSLHIVGSLTSKLPSIMFYYYNNYILWYSMIFHDIPWYSTAFLAGSSFRFRHCRFAPALSRWKLSI